MPSSITFSHIVGYPTKRLNQFQGALNNKNMWEDLETYDYVLNEYLLLN